MRLPPTSIVPALLAAVSVAACGSDAPRSITTVSWGGSYGRAVNEGANIPFTEATGIRIEIEDYNGGLAQIRAQVDIGDIHWDVVDLEIADAVRGCDEGLLEPIDVNSLPAGADGTPAAEDFVAEGRTECGVGNLYWSTVYAYNDENIPGTKPATMADFFDLEAFPGRRGMRRVPQVNLEFALIADGVPLDQVYATLDTPEGLDRAFAVLETIRDEVIWWEAGAQPPQMLADGEVIMSTAYNGRIFNAQVLENQPFVIVWDGQLLDVGQVGIVAGTPRLAEALEYVAFSTSAESMARIARRISYSPMRRSGMPLVTTHVVAGVEMEPHMPASPANSARALRYDWSWWVDHQDELNERFSAWLAR
ncbi:MAG: ABC transporter substrate-binding protein [Gemmatimonadetes bacterium]|nr:ABC transporter substrate-binding protein [Gemmatimonadota bacterium]MXX71840.1 ABC transporter substrate-binding protein [Gemmatimonadota bacterium]MYC91956.1 ABC transporter substrate-binding protein [Gemmatimonadota bacterium]MYG34060.1 ABC transporter substrate-binding protein [Gemmatimonadota bacterium]MYJ18987.1 ABC transporter substrate-binding protein [Gemmatimonadota bacterium]